MKQTITTVVALLLSLTTWAQWTKPSAPATQPLALDQECYLYNVDADAFWLGANDWGTRVSVSPKHGFKIKLGKYNPSKEELWDGVSYRIKSHVELPGGWQDGLWMDSKMADWNSIWVDAEDGNQDDHCWAFNQEADGTYTIGLSPLNEKLTQADYPGAFLAVNAEGDDNRVYLITQEKVDGNPTGYCKRWAFVSETDYTAYINAVEQYEAAVKLGEYLAEAKAAFPAVDFSSVEAVYNNQASTAQQLTEALTTTLQLMMAVASPTSPADVTWKYVTNPSYDNNDNEGWGGTKPGFQSFGNAEHYWANYDTYQTVKVPAGVYRAKVTAFYRAGWADLDAEATEAMKDCEGGIAPHKNAKLYISSKDMGELSSVLPFASEGATAESLCDGTLENSLGFIPNNMAAAANYFEAGRYPATEVVGMMAADGELTFGLKKSVTRDGDWTIFDDWKLEYIGNDATAYGYLKSSALANEVNYVSLVENEELEYYCHAAYDAYKAAREALETATTAEAIAAAIGNYNRAAQVMAASVEAYATYVAKFSEVSDYIGENSDKLMGDGVDVLYDYLEGDKGPGDCNPRFVNGGALYILDNGTLSTEDILKEITLLQTLFDEMLASGMQDGQDCTELVKNPHFNEAGVWEKEGLPEWPKGTDGYSLAEAYSILFNVSQTLTGLQNGLYELELSDLFRPANFDTEAYNNPCGYVYMNDTYTAMNHIESEATDEAAHESDAQLAGIGKYVPNNIDGVVKAFRDGRYRQKVYGLVTDGTLKIGVCNKWREEGCWALWSDMKLTFRAKNPEALANVLSLSMPEAEAKMDNKCGNEELAALQAAIDAAKAEPEDGYQALVDLKNAMGAVDVCTESYANLFVAAKSASECLDNNEGKTSAALTALQALFDEAYAAYEAGSYNNQAAVDMIAAINSAVSNVIFGGDSAEEQDVTDLIVNNNFDPARGVKGGDIEGWVTSPTNGYKEYTCSYNRAAIDLHQELKNLPAGHYRVTVHTYYRAGYWDEEWNRKEAGEETHLTTLYAQTPDKKYEKPVMNLYEGALDAPIEGKNFYNLPNGKFAPDGTSPTVASFEAGHYLNTLEFDVTEDGSSVTIGLSKTEILANDYEVVGAWNLYYTPAPKMQDVTDLIVNNNFDPARGVKGGDIEGWVTSPTNGYKEYTCSYNRAAIDLHQELKNLPAGHYRVTVHTYYRAGYWDEEWNRKEAGEETHLTTLYAQTPDKKYEKPVMNLYEGALDAPIEGKNFYNLPNGKFAPDGTSPTAASFEAGHYLNTLEFDVTEDGSSVTIGLSKTEILANDYEVVGAWNLYYMPTTQKPEPKDVTNLIVNNNFDPARGVKGGDIEGWVTSPTNGYKEYTCSYNRAAIDLHQELKNLPAGDYKVTVHTYYRAGYWDEEWSRKEAGEEIHLTTLYAQTPDKKYETPVMNLYEGALDEPIEGKNFYNLPNGKFAPDGTSPTAAAFEAGYYLNELAFTVAADGSTVTIGLKKNEILANDYEVVGAWNLYYYGKDSGIVDGIESVREEAAPASAAAGIYNLSGVRMGTLQRGINIVKTADGRVLKLFVR